MVIRMLAKIPHLCNTDINAYLICLLQLLRMFIKDITHCLSDVEVVAVAEMAHGHVGGDLKAVCLEGEEGREGDCSETRAAVTPRFMTSFSVFPNFLCTRMLIGHWHC